MIEKDKATLSKLIKLYETGKANEAVDFARQSINTPDHLHDLNYTCAAVLIDRGGEIHDQGAIETGIELFRGFVEDESVDASLRNQAAYKLIEWLWGVAVHDTAVFVD